MCILCDLTERFEKEGTQWLTPSLKACFLILVLHELLHSAVLIIFLRPLKELQILFMGFSFSQGIRIDFFEHPLGYVSTSAPINSELLAVFFYLAPTLLTVIVPIRFAFSPRNIDNGILFLFWYLLGLQDLIRLTTILLPPVQNWYFLSVLDVFVLVLIYIIPLIFAIVGSLLYFLFFFEYTIPSERIKNFS